MTLLSELKKTITGTVDISSRTRRQFAHDNGPFYWEPYAVVRPRQQLDVQKLVRFIASHKDSNATLSLTARGKGSGFCGSSLNDSVIIDTRLLQRQPRRHGRQITIGSGDSWAALLCRSGQQANSPPIWEWPWPDQTVGAAIASGRCQAEPGQQVVNIKSLKVVLSNGQTCTFRDLPPKELQHKLEQKNFEGHLYREIFKLLDDHQRQLRISRPTVRNNSGYNLWDVQQPATGHFNLIPLFIGSEGTLGIITEATVHLPQESTETTQRVFQLTDETSISSLAKHLQAIPAQATFLSIPTLRAIYKNKTHLNNQQKAALLLRECKRSVFGQRPKSILIVTLEHAAGKNLSVRLAELSNKLQEFGAVASPQTPPPLELLTRLLSQPPTLPFLQDSVVPLQYLGDFLAGARHIIHKYNLPVCIAAKLTDGHFFFTPTEKMNLAPHLSRLLTAAEELRTLALRFHGSVSGQLGDGLYGHEALQAMYGPHIYHLFEQTKQIFDPQGIFNPHKKTNGRAQIALAHLDPLYS